MDTVLFPKNDALEKVKLLSLIRRDFSVSTVLVQCKKIESFEIQNSGKHHPNIALVTMLPCKHNHYDHSIAILGVFSKYNPTFSSVRKKTPPMFKWAPTSFQWSYTPYKSP